MSSPMYWDATLVHPPRPSALSAYQAAMNDGWPDIHGVHLHGKKSRQLLDNSRAAIAQILGVQPGDVYFVSNGPEALRDVVAGIFHSSSHRRPELIVSAVERAAVINTARYLESQLSAINRTVAVNAEGVVDISQLEELVSRKCALVAVQQANSEVGSVQPLELVRRICRACDVPLVVDATASAGHLQLPSDWDVLVLDSQSWGSFPAVGIVAMRPHVRWLAPWAPGEYERSRKVGPVDVAAVLAAAATIGEAVEEAERGDDRDEIISELRMKLAKIPDAVVAGSPDNRLPHILTTSFLYCDGESLVERIAREGFSVGSGSACTASTLEPSHVLTAMGSLTHGNIRIGLPRTPNVSDSDIQRFLTAVSRSVEDVRRQLGASNL